MQIHIGSLIREELRRQGRTYSTATPNGSIQSDKHKTPPNQKLKKTVPSTINCHEFMVITR